MSAELIAKLESASEGSVWSEADANELIDALGRDRCGPSFAAVPLVLLALQGSIDAALALSERVLPRWGWDFGKPARMGEHGGQPWADCWPPVEDGELRAFRLGGPRPTPNHTNASTPALAICAAILRASAAEGAGK